MIKYLFAVRYTPCDKETNDYCLIRNRKKKTCGIDSLLKCGYPLMKNPLCTSNDIKNCFRSYDIFEHDKHIYIFYRCASCNNLVKCNAKDMVNKFLKPLNDENIYYGKDLEKLMEKVIPQEHISDGIDFMVDFMRANILPRL